MGSDGHVRQEWGRGERFWERHGDGARETEARARRRRTESEREREDRWHAPGEAEMDSDDLVQNTRCRMRSSDKRGHADYIHGRRGPHTLVGLRLGLGPRVALLTCCPAPRCGSRGRGGAGPGPGSVPGAVTTGALPALRFSPSVSLFLPFFFLVAWYGCLRCYSLSGNLQLENIKISKQVHLNTARVLKEIKSIISGKCLTLAMPTRL